MKVADIMQKHVDFVSGEATVLDVARLIFGRRINGVPVCGGKKLLGMVTERDIVEQFFPSVQEVVEDFAHARDFELMEEKINEILNLPVSKIMSKNPTTVNLETPLLRAQSLMQVREIGRLPVIDKKGNLIGIVSKGDVFRALVGGKIPYAEDEEYHDWLSRHYDLVVKWETRLGNEIPNLMTLFRKEKVKKVLDVGCGTGEHDIALAKRGLEVTALESSTLMFKTSKEKWEKLPKEVKRRLKFIRGDYVEMLENRPQQFGAAIFMGNALSHIPHNFKNVLASVSKALLPKNSLLIAQIINFEKVFKVKNRFLDFNIAESRLAYEKEHLFLEFYDPPREKGGHLTLNMAILDFDGRRWAPWRLNSTPIAHITKENIKPILQRLGFRKIAFYGGMFLGPLFKEPFKPLEHDWLNVVARK